MSNTKNSKLQNDVDYLQNIIFRLSWAAQKRLAKELELFGITLPQYSALRAIRLHPQNNCNMTELAEASLQVTATMTGIVDRLSDRGLVNRQRDPSDRRSMQVFLTEKGEQVLNDIEAHQRLRLEHILTGVPYSERKALIHLMEWYLHAILTEIDNQ